MQDALDKIYQSLSEWENSIKNPLAYQKMVLESLLQDYSRTDYGHNHQAADVSNINEYQNMFPVINYQSITPWLEKVKEGNPQAFLSEKPITWVMTRGTTGQSKILPVTPRLMRDLVKGGSRAVLNFAIKNGEFGVLMGGVLNLQFPSNMATMKNGSDELIYGFSSGTYAKLNPMEAGLHLVPRQEEIDALETDLTVLGWEKRYEFIYQQAKEEDIVTMMGVAPVQTGFARYMKKRHGIYPKEVWDLQVIFSTSVPKIQTKYGNWLRKMYGNIPVVEMYSATEGAFGQQRDEMPYIVPNFDVYLFEVKTRRGLKMLHDLERGEWGRLIISNAFLPRYDIGDLIEGMGKRYYRVFGRDRPLTVIEHIIYRTLFRWFL
jgi:hypothetical protein